ncbi:MMPL family transporter [Caldibacillus lycopersici]|uniref:MMPL family transporter n=1 Tax=Perspicuibacillus lycopersici TaxID=1325689 RepID=A0AAE3LMH5_9BACI|nr:MMPL family transporter [Perspicuibacillus lycopersici]MCU9612941.1 MMPL family transporter [Perspicuibacillus lycopersici]
MKGIIKSKWFIVVAWLVAVVVLMLSAPNMADLVREKGELEVADGYSSKVAQQIINEVNEQEGLGNTTSVALVFHNEDGLTATNMEEAKQAVNRLEQQKEELGITNILTHFNQKELEEQLLAKDGKTILVSLTIDWQNRTANDLSNDLYSAIDDINLEHYYTGSSFIDEDVILTSQDGLKQTEVITVVFILVVLILVFRSVVAPFIPLITVGISYLAAQSVVAFLIEYFNFPISNFTQIFLVAVLFGIGTDYSILLLSRFKEELSVQESLTAAIVETYKHAGKTVFFSGIAVLIGFAVIGFSQFKLYQSASAVAVGIAVLLAALFTIVPFFMAVLGKKLFWPSKGSLEHKPSKLWNFAGRFSFARPIIALLIVAVITVPFIITEDGDLSYNSMEEIGDDYNSVKGFEIISDSFGPGESMPTKIVIKNDEAMDQKEYFYLVEAISQNLEKVDGIQTVRSLTRPTGEKLEDLLVANQADQLKEGIGEGNDGIAQIRDGLSEASEQLSSSTPQLAEATDGIDSLISGTDELKSGINELQSGLEQIENGVRDGSLGAGELKAGLKEIKQNAESLLAGYQQLQGGYTQYANEMKSAYQTINQSISAFADNEKFAQLQQALEYLDNYFATADADPSVTESFYQLKAFTENLQPQLQGLMAGIQGLEDSVGQLEDITSSFQQLNGGLEALIAGMDNVIDGIDSLEQGLNRAADGQETIINQLPAVTNGLGEINNGQEQLLAGFSGIGDQLGALTNGLASSVDGLTQVHDGLNTASDFLDDLASSSENTGIYIPDELLENEQFGQVLDTYLSNDRKIMTIDVIFDENPYSIAAIDKVDDLEDAVARAVADTKLENAQVAINGVTSTYHDLSTMSDHDFSKTVVYMLVGIGIILIILFRSFVMPIYLVASLLLTYFTTMGITEFIFINLLGYDGITWAVPFFSFVILIALGVDYSIFLMGRFNEYRNEPIKQAMIHAMSNMGTVIMSAVIILGGTFAAMIPSGVLSLLQIATVVISGLLLYSLVILPLFVPVMVKIFGKANWWPFIEKNQE